MPKTTRAYCCTKHINWIRSCRLWNNRPRPQSLGIVAYIFAARKNIAGRYFRERIFSREDIFAGRYFRVNSIFAKISSRENISNSLFAKFSSRENKVLYSKYISDSDNQRLVAAGNKLNAAFVWLQQSAVDIDSKINLL